MEQRETVRLPEMPPAENRLVNLLRCKHSLPFEKEGE